MEKTITSFGTDLKDKLLYGIKQLNNSVSSTLGPAGRTVLIKDPSGEIRVTKDGVTVAKAFQELENQVESIGAELAKKVSDKFQKITINHLACSEKVKLASIV